MKFLRIAPFYTLPTNETLNTLFQAEMLPQAIECRVEELLIQQPAIHHQRATAFGENQSEVGPEVRALELEQVRRDLEHVGNNRWGGVLVLISDRTASGS
jgi:hypothetical protein